MTTITPDSKPFVIVLFAAAVALCTIVPSCNEHDENEDIPPVNDDDADDSDDSDAESEDDDQCPDSDGDLWCSPEDCADNNPFVNPGMIEDCFDGLDNDCNFLIDDEDPACNESDGNKSQQP
jgi:Putative metal-binding motif